MPGQPTNAHRSIRRKPAGRRNTKAFVSLFFGVLTIVVALQALAQPGEYSLGLGGLTVMLPTASLAMVLGLRAKAEVRDATGAESGDGQATAELTIGVTGTGLSILATIAQVI